MGLKHSHFGVPMGTEVRLSGAGSPTPHRRHNACFFKNVRKLCTVFISSVCKACLEYNPFFNIRCIFFGRFWTDFLEVAQNLFAIASLLFFTLAPFFCSQPSSKRLLIHVTHWTGVVRLSDRKAFGCSLCPHTKLSNPDPTISY